MNINNRTLNFFARPVVALVILVTVCARMSLSAYFRSQYDRFDFILAFQNNKRKNLWPSSVVGLPGWRLWNILCPKGRRLRAWLMNRPTTLEAHGYTRTGWARTSTGYRFIPACTRVWGEYTPRDSPNPTRQRSEGLGVCSRVRTNPRRDVNDIGGCCWSIMTWLGQRQFASYIRDPMNQSSRIVTRSTDLTTSCSSATCSSLLIHFNWNDRLNKLFFSYWNFWFSIVQQESHWKIEISKWNVFIRTVWIFYFY